MVFLRIVIHIYFIFLVAYCVWKKSKNIWICSLLIPFIMDIISFREIRPYLYSEIVSLLVLDYLLSLSIFNVRWFYIFIIQLLWINIHPESFIFYPLYCIKFIQDCVNYRHKKNFFMAVIKNGLLILTCLLTPDHLNLWKRVISGVHYPSNDWLPVWEWISRSPFFAWVTIFFILINIYFLIVNGFFYRTIQWFSIISSIYFIVLSSFYIRLNWLLCLSVILVISTKICNNQKNEYRIEIYHWVFCVFFFLLFLIFFEARLYGKIHFLMILYPI